MRLFSDILTWAFLALAIAADHDGFIKVDFNVVKDRDFKAPFPNLIRNPPWQSNSNHPAFSRNSAVSKAEGDASGTEEVSLSNQRQFYVANLAIGTPPQNVQVLLDTGSSDLWVMSAENPYCQSNGGFIDCSQYGTFNEKTSSSFKPSTNDLNIQYMDGTFAEGIFGQDTVSLGNGFSLDGATFAVATNSTSNVAVFGIAFQGLESTSNQYTNLPAQMKQDGFINKVAYSLYITSQEDSTGSILFGGIDHAKYSGDLVSIDVTKYSNGAYVYLQIPLSSVSVSVNETEPDRSSVISSSSSSVFTSTVSPISILPGTTFSTPATGSGFTTTSPVSPVSVSTPNIFSTVSTVSTGATTITPSHPVTPTTFYTIPVYTPQTLTTSTTTTSSKPKTTVAQPTTTRYHNDNRFGSPPQPSGSAVQGHNHGLFGFLNNIFRRDEKLGSIPQPTVPPTHGRTRTGSDRFGAPPQPSGTAVAGHNHGLFGFLNNIFRRDEKLTTTPTVSAAGGRTRTGSDRFGAPPQPSGSAVAGHNHGLFGFLDNIFRRDNHGYPSGVPTHGKRGNSHNKDRFGAPPQPSGTAVAGHNHGLFGFLDNIFRRDAELTTTPSVSAARSRTSSNSFGAPPQPSGSAVAGHNHGLFGFLNNIFKRDEKLTTTPTVSAARGRTRTGSDRFGAPPQPSGSAVAGHNHGLFGFLDNIFRRDNHGYPSGVPTHGKRALVHNKDRFGAPPQPSGTAVAGHNHGLFGFLDNIFRRDENVSATPSISAARGRTGSNRFGAPPQPSGTAVAGHNHGLFGFLNNIFRRDEKLTTTPTVSAARSRTTSDRFGAPPQPSGTAVAGHNHGLFGFLNNIFKRDEELGTTTSISAARGRTRTGSDRFGAPPQPSGTAVAGHNHGLFGFLNNIFRRDEKLTTTPTVSAARGRTRTGSDRFGAPPQPSGSAVAGHNHGLFGFLDNIFRRDNHGYPSGVPTHGKRGDGHNQDRFGAPPQPSGTAVEGHHHGLLGIFENLERRSDNEKRVVSEISTNNAPALLDSGTTLTYLPQSVIDSIVDKAAPGYGFNNIYGGVVVPCSLKAPQNHLTFNFNGQKEIQVPFSDLILQTTSETGEQVCLLGILPNDEIVLGDNFLRSCYSVFNLDDKTISIAQMNYSNDEQIEVIQ
ncbi:aspartic peptidase domain-containing protein [Scheffersomyces xylosifermentans]|uniref:aspartic peptidase domain-containing protein n=1 Tax=Scheffersomyces xylosifermentans TaxID=1304137 RepID=UPI00315DDFAF